MLLMSLELSPCYSDEYIQLVDKGNDWAFQIIHLKHSDTVSSPGKVQGKDSLFSCKKSLTL